MAWPGSDPGRAGYADRISWHPPAAFPQPARNRPVDVIYRSPKPIIASGKRKTQLHILQELPGIGPERALTLLERFGSIEAVLTASAKELAMVKGIGKHTAKSIQWAVHEAEPEQYF